MAKLSDIEAPNVVEDEDVVPPTQLEMDEKAAMTEAIVWVTSRSTDAHCPLCDTINIAIRAN